MFTRVVYVREIIAFAAHDLRSLLKLIHVSHTFREAALVYPHDDMWRNVVASINSKNNKQEPIIARLCAFRKADHAQLDFLTCLIKNGGLSVNHRIQSPLFGTQTLLAYVLNLGNEQLALGLAKLGGSMALTTACGFVVSAAVDFLRFLRLVRDSGSTVSAYRLDEGTPPLPAQPYFKACGCGHFELALEMLHHPDLNEVRVVLPQSLYTVCYFAKTTEGGGYVAADPGAVTNAVALARYLISSQMFKEGRIQLFPNATVGWLCREGSSSAAAAHDETPLGAAIRNRCVPLIRLLAPVYDEALRKGRGETSPSGNSNNVAVSDQRPAMNYPLLGHDRELPLEYAVLTAVDADLVQCILSLGASLSFVPLEARRQCRQQPQRQQQQKPAETTMTRHILGVAEAKFSGDGSSNFANVNARQSRVLAVLRRIAVQQGWSA